MHELTYLFDVFLAGMAIGVMLMAVLYRCNRWIRVKIHAGRTPQKSSWLNSWLLVDEEKGTVSINPEVEPVLRQIIAREEAAKGRRP
jgi:hypothetical protein